MYNLRAAVSCIAICVCAACGTSESSPPSTQCTVPERPASQDRVRFEPVFQTLAISDAVSLVQHPNDSERWYVVAKSGIVYTFSNAEPAASPILDLSDKIVEAGEAGVLDIAFHPDFATRGEVFVSYTGAGSRGEMVSRVSRFTSSDQGRTLDPTTETVILEVAQPYSNHNGGGIGFSPNDGFLYVGLGDGGSGGDPQGHAQNTETLLGSMLRIDVDGGDPYAIPADNPFVTEGGRPEIFAWGLRNPWRWSFDTETGDLWAGDVGQHVWEEVNRIERGGNYGWNIKEGAECYGNDTCDEGTLSDPVVAYRNTLAASVVGGQVYRGSAMPDLVGGYIYSDFYTGTLWSVRQGEEPEILSASGAREISSFAQATDGELYAISYRGSMYRLVPEQTNVANTFPEMLSQTGCVDPEAPSQPAEGVLPYDVNVPFWSDGATKQRWMAIPKGQTVQVNSDGDWDLPVGSVLIKSFTLGEQIVETRLMMRHRDGGWAGYSYEWNDAGTDAQLLTKGKTKTINGQTWSFPARDECLFCHTSPAGRSLGLETAQLNLEITDSDGETINQLEHFTQLNILPSIAQSTSYPPLDSDASVTQRARAYLHVNCSHCHRPDAPGGRSQMNLLYTTPLQETGICDLPPRSGDIGIIDARIVAPGDPARSVLLTRMKTLGSTRMPLLSTHVIDEQGQRIIDSWIQELSGCSE